MRQQCGKPAVVEAYFAERRTAGYHNERTRRAMRPMTTTSME